MIINKITNGLYRIENFIPQVTMDYVNSLINLPGSTDGSKGTSFKLKNGEIYEFPFEANTGYFMDNRERIMHGCPTPVKPGATRYSLYVRYQNK